MPEIELHPDWLRHLGDEFSQPHMLGLKQFLRQAKDSKTVIYPPGRLIFNALNSTPPQAVKAVIIGQDPYHGPGQAHGLSFSVPDGVQPPPSLQNIFKEIQRDLGISEFASGNLTSWARQGVLLLNSVLTVTRGQAASHQGRGWEPFTDRVIQVLNETREHLVFMLWGAHAQKKGHRVDPQRHRVLKTTHPSPLSAHRGFLGCGHFSSCNDYLSAHGVEPIDWAVRRAD